VNSFNELDVDPSIQKALSALGFSTPTPIQAQAIPIGLSGKDLIGCAQTGSGKTIAFLIPILNRLIKNPEETALVLVPTRELASQVHAAYESLAQFLPHIKSAVLIGGASMSMQHRMLRRNPRIAVATPGRLLDHLDQGTIKLDFNKFLVLDEADRMLDMGFAPQLREILRYLPRERQTMLFSATVPANILKLSQDYLTNPVKVTVSQDPESAPKIEQQTREIQAENKDKVLLAELSTREGLVLVFARTQARTDRVARFLGKSGIDVASIHGGKRQRQREEALESFRQGRVRILVATDIAARGIDVSQVAHVINYDLPQAPEDYVHRIGRTGRAGKSGVALTLITPADNQLWRAICKIMKPGEAVAHSSTPRVFGPRGSSGGERSNSSTGKKRFGNRRFSNKSGGGRNRAQA